MGMPIPNAEPSSRQHALDLMSRKELIEAQIDHQFSLLRMNDSTMHSPLLDSQGFPRADIDIVVVRNARVRVIELSNDLKAIMEEISQALQGVYRPNPIPSDPVLPPAASAHKTNGNVPDTPFALVDGVAPNSPAAQSGLQRGDLFVRFGDLSITSFPPPISLAPIATLVSAHENRPIELRVQRKLGAGGSTYQTLTLTPRAGWGGRGLLG